MEPNRLPSSTELPEPVESPSLEGGLISTPEMALVPSDSQPHPSIQSSVTASAIPTHTVPVQQSALPIDDAALIADDADLIEKEWVLKAKAIVAHTAHDPNLQTKEMGKVRAEYLKKRYNKSLKLDES